MWLLSVLCDTNKGRLLHLYVLSELLSMYAAEAGRVISLLSEHRLSAEVITCQ